MCANLDNPERSGRIVDIQEVDEPRERDGEEVCSLPKTAQLLVLHRSAHLELTESVTGLPS